jgi:hypothetical protein
LIQLAFSEGSRRGEDKPLSEGTRSGSGVRIGGVVEHRRFGRQEIFGVDCNIVPDRLTTDIGSTIRCTAINFKEGVAGTMVTLFSIDVVDNTITTFW